MEGCYAGKWKIKKEAVPKLFKYVAQRPRRFTQRTQGIDNKEKLRCVLCVS